MDLRLLGTTEVTVDGGPRAVGGQRQRGVLADLALNAGRVVMMSELIEDLWGGSPPASAAHTIETYVSRLRRVLSSEDRPSVLVKGGSGYVLNVGPEQVDALYFGLLVGKGSTALQRGDAVAAKGILSGALALWRGAALADVRDSAFAPVAARRLEADRLAALESLMDARLQLGEHRELVSELEHAVALDPYRERFHAQLMLALYRSGRQADALAAFQQARTRLAHELGIEPSRELRELERGILLQAPELDPPSSMPSSVGVLASPSPPEQHAPTDEVGAPGSPHSSASSRAIPRWRLVAVCGAAALALVAAAGVPVLLRSSPPARAAAVGPSGLASTSNVASSISLPNEPGGALAADGSIWVTSPVAHALYRIDPVTGATEDTVAVGAGASAVAFSGADIWVANTLDGTVSRVSSVTDGVVQTVAVGPEPTGLAVGDGSLWVADASASTLTAINATSGGITSTQPISSPPFGVAFGAGSVWLASPRDDIVTRVEPGGGANVQISVGADPTAITFGLGSVWVANQLDDTVSRIDPATDSVVAEIPVGDGPDGLAIYDGAVWVANLVSSTVTRVDPTTNSAGPVVLVKEDPVALTAFAGRIWAATGAPAGGVAKGGTLRVVTTEAVTSIDPDFIYPFLPYQFGEGTYDGLMNFDQVGGSDGLQVVPDLALAMPTVTAGGTAYTFVLRPGIRYSDGRLVRPEDFRRAIERALVLSAQDGFFLDGIVGASSCRNDRPCNLDRGITVSDSADTVTFHLIGPDADFLYKLTFEFTAPIPPGTPWHDVGDHPVPSTGPYMIAHYVPGHDAEFVRNPYFHVWSTAAEPAGVPDRIIWTELQTIPAEVAAVKRGQADWLWDTVPDPAALIAQYPGQVHVNPTMMVTWAWFNVTVPPFNDLRVRQAVNLAVNRAQYVAMMGGPDGGTLTCQILTPGVPGYGPYCPFTVDPNPAGNWVGPNLPLARKLVAESGTRGMRVVVWGHQWDLSTTAFVVSLLKELGYRASSVTVTDHIYNDIVNNSANHTQAGDSTWGADYPSASEFFEFHFACSGFRLDDAFATIHANFFCNPSIDRQMQAANQEEASNSPAADASWAQIDRELTDAAAWVPLEVSNEVDFMSARVSNYQYNPVFGVLLDQLSVRHNQGNGTNG
jgi:YVTN family beta-propeller protein